jgi:hypothetical protein
MGDRRILLALAVAAAVALLAFSARSPASGGGRALQVASAALLLVALSSGIQHAFVKGSQNARQRWNAGLSALAQRLGVDYRAGGSGLRDLPSLVGAYAGFSIRIAAYTHGEGPLQTIITVQLPGLTSGTLRQIDRLRVRGVRVSSEGGSGPSQTPALVSAAEAALSVLAARVEAVELGHSEILVVTPVSRRGLDPTYGIETDPDVLLELLELTLDVARPLARAP